MRSSQAGVDREVSHAIAVEVAAIAFKRGIARVSPPADWSAAVKAAMYEPVYVTYERRKTDPANAKSRQNA